MSETERFEVLVIGSGEAGKYLGWTMAKAGHRTAVVERSLVGGSCPISPVSRVKTLFAGPRSRLLRGREPNSVSRNRVACRKHGGRAAS
jgi:hypothetical protein